MVLFRIAMQWNLHSALCISSSTTQTVKTRQVWWQKPTGLMSIQIDFYLNNRSFSNFMSPRLLFYCYQNMHTVACDRIQNFLLPLTFLDKEEDISCSLIHIFFDLLNLLVCKRWIHVRFGYQWHCYDHTRTIQSE